MKIDNQLIEKLARLSQLEFDEAQRDSIRADLESMVDFVKQIEEIDTKGVEPLVYMHDGIVTARQDEVKDELSREDLFRNAPAREGNYFVVPKVIHKPGN